MRRAVMSIAGGLLGLVVGWVAVAQPVAAAVAATVVTWSAGNCPAGVYTITATAVSLASGKTFSTTSTGVQLPQPSVTQQFTNLPSGEYVVSATARRNGGATFGSATQTITANGAAGTSVPRSRPSTREPSGFARPRNATTTRVTDVVRIVSGSLDWQRLDFVDNDDDGEIDAIRIELTNGKVLTWRIAR